MKTWKRFKAFLSSIPARAHGCHLPSSRDNVVRLRANAPTVSREATLKLWPDLVDLPRDYYAQTPVAPKAIPDDLPIG